MLSYKDLYANGYASEYEAVVKRLKEREGSPEVEHKAVQDIDNNSRYLFPYDRQPQSAEREVLKQIKQRSISKNC